MKSFFTLAIIVLCSILFHRCVTQKATATASAYDIPDHVTAANRQAFLDKCEKGKVLYKIHCAGCHGIFTKGKDSIPNFTKIQIDSYHAAALIGIDPRNHAVAKKMSAEQIDQVITFLRLRKIE